jgi:hypothetical protein
MPITFLQLARKIIEEERNPLAPNEIWEIAVSKGYEKELNTKGKTPWATLGAQLYVDVRDNPNSLFLVTDSRPKRFFLHSLVDVLGKKSPSTGTSNHSTKNPISRKRPTSVPSVLWALLSESILENDSPQQVGEKAVR